MPHPRRTASLPPSRRRLLARRQQRLSEPWLLTRTSKTPLALATTSIELGSAAVPPSASSCDCDAQTVALRHQNIDDAVGEGHDDLTAR